MIQWKFEKTWGGNDNWYTKSKRWANKQKFPVNHLALGFIEWLHKHWIDGKIEMEMDSVDKQVEEIHSQWEDEERKQFAPEVVEEGVFGDEGWSISISNPIVDRGSEGSESGMDTGSDASGLQQNEGDQTP
ncbi:hypothetical protein CYXG_00090 [Synechococcus phage S-SSM4]|jgi:hypothetical protein|uniref:Uncharacterized protein n=1 Tax=Synechococcus phage S-SSM4 TaxID=536466 RepID=M1TUP8_9CAUD|nr:hypothetical protein CYXG_00090 [Synechococcus phage S-SSM4]AGG54154.1 hypothetical protein CYXG_00090 [Synechococcus phage S-SSM4]AGG54487.1 hypothetical protein CYWG_00203 [Cyanophage S-SSM6b]|tara:strand:+ start:164 stop:556 length:393 start_codon:yes stop_codon:yes gene_type:complete